MDKLTGQIVNIKFVNQENGYTIATMRTEDFDITVVGSLPGCHEGASYELDGEMVFHPKFGEQFKFSKAKEIMPQTAEGIIAFLSSDIIKGIGEKVATKIVDAFGEETFDVIENQPHKLLLIDGIGEKTLQKIIETYGEHKEFADVSVSLQGFGITTAQALKIYRVYGKDSVKAIQENPYILTEEVEGFGFIKADKIASNMGIDWENPERIEAGIMYVLEQATNDGNVYLPTNVLIEKARDLLGVDSERIQDAIFDLGYSKIKIDAIDGQEVIYPVWLYQAEQRICGKLLALKDAGIKPITLDIPGLIKKSETEEDVELSEKQKHAIISSIKEGVSVITGGPGTGKTTIINTIMNIMDEADLDVAIAAPTGRAAKRITETSGREAKTIHRLLGYYFDEGTKSMNFHKDEDNPLECDVVIIDESSMIDTYLMDVLLNAISEGTRLILVGDVDQLPSVGAGNVLRDIINSEFIHTVELTEIFRQAKESMIVVNAHRINKGEYPYCNETDSDFFFMKKNNERMALELINELVTGRLQNYYTWCDPIKDIQVITPVKKGTLGNVELNGVLQEALNPPTPSKKEKQYGMRTFREGDKIMQTVNNYQIQWKSMKDFTDGEGVFNGDIGYVDSIDLDEGVLCAIFDDDKFVTYSFSELDQIELAYAITVHKSQGSEFPIVIMPMTWFPPILATRNLLYTAVTRGKKVVIIAGSEDRMKAMIDNNKIVKRFSGLDYRIKKCFLNEL